MQAVALLAELAPIRPAGGKGGAVTDAPAEDRTDATDGGQASSPFAALLAQLLPQAAAPSAPVETRETSSRDAVTAQAASSLPLDGLLTLQLSPASGEAAIGGPAAPTTPDALPSDGAPALSVDTPVALPTASGADLAPTQADKPTPRAAASLALAASLPLAPPPAGSAIPDVGAAPAAVEPPPSIAPIIAAAQGALRSLSARTEPASVASPDAPATAETGALLAKAEAALPVAPSSDAGADQSGQELAGGEQALADLPTPEASAEDFTPAPLAAPAHTSRSELGQASAQAAVVAGQTVADLAAQLAGRLEKGARRFEVQLTPEGLGAVDVSVRIAADGTLAARLGFDDPAVAGELKARADELRQQLAQVGFDVARDAISFDLNQRGGNGQAQTGQGWAAAQTFEAWGEAVSDRTARSAASFPDLGAAAPAPTRSARAAGLDLRV